MIDRWYSRLSHGTRLVLYVLLVIVSGNLGLPGSASAENAICVSQTRATTAGKTILSGSNQCGIPVQYNVCATVAGSADIYHFSQTLKPDEKWSLAFANPASKSPNVKADFCRPGQSCAVTCQAAQLQGIIWAARPGAEAMASAYPQRAQNEDVGGSVALSCTISEALRPVKCTIEAETPAGYGFGNAAMGLAGRFYKAAPQTADGKPAAGQPAEIKIRFGTQ